MTTSTITIGTKFKTGYVKRDGSLSELSGECRVYEITESRICYTDGTKSSCGSSNRKQAGHWLTIKGFEKRIKQGTIEII